MFLHTLSLFFSNFDYLGSYGERYLIFDSIYLWSHNMFSIRVLSLKKKVHSRQNRFYLQTFSGYYSSFQRVFLVSWKLWSYIFDFQSNNFSRTHFLHKFGLRLHQFLLFPTFSGGKGGGKFFPSIYCHGMKHDQVPR